MLKFVRIIIDFVFYITCISILHLIFNSSNNMRKPKIEELHVLTTKKFIGIKSWSNILR